MAQGLLKGKGCDILFKKKGNILCTLAPSLAYADTDKSKKEINQYRHIYQDGKKQYLLEGITCQELQTISAPFTLDYEIKTGGLDNNETWKEGNTYYISGNLTINSGATLVIEPGTICKYSTARSLIAASGGRLIAKGDKFNYILMTSWKDKTVGENVYSSTGNPSASDYNTAINLPANTISDHHIEYCKISYSGYGMNIQTKIDKPIQNNILRNIGCYGIYASRGNGPNGDGVVIRNNLLINDGVGIYTNGDERPENRCFIDFYNNTLDNNIIGVYVNSSYPINCWANILSNGTYGFYGSNASADCDHQDNKFYAVTNSFYGGTLSAGYIDETLTQNPYVTSPNGCYYLDQTNTHVVDSSPDMVSDIFKTKTTTKPLEAINDISTDTTWDKVLRDEWHLDVGYHYDPVDVVVGSSSKPIITIYSATTSANLRIYPGVVVSFWRSLTQNNCQIKLNNGKFIAHGHADDRIQFRNIYETGDMPTYSLSSGDPYGYYFGIEFGSGVEPESYAQYCEFHHACSGILLDQNIAKPMYRRFSDNIFNGCYYGITAIDAYLRAENNLFLCNSNSSTQILLFSSCNTTILRNNSFIGNLSGSLGIYSEANGNIDIRNNIFTGFKGTAIKLPSNSLTGKISKNCYFNNSINNTVNSINIEDPIYQTPQFAWSTASSVYWNGYYLAQTTGDVSRFPMSADNVSDIDITGLSRWGLFSFPQITIYSVNESNNTKISIGYRCPDYYEDGQTSLGNLMIVINGEMEFVDGDYITINFANGSNLKVTLPAEHILSSDSLILWVAIDGSTYYGRKCHSSDMCGEPDQDAWYAMNYDATGLGKASFSNMGISTCVNSGDTTTRAFGSTATYLSRDTGKVDIGYHPMNKGFLKVADSGRKFEFEDGSVFFPIGHNCWNFIYAFQTTSDTFHYPQLTSFLSNMTSNGCNFMRVLLDYPLSDRAHTLESHLATSLTSEPIFDESSETFWLEQFFNLTEEYGIYTLISPWNSYDMKIGWDTTINNHVVYSPIYTAPDIICNNFHDMLDTTNSLALYNEKKKYEYIIKRWGNIETFAAWDVMNEINLFEKTESMTSNWLSIMANYIRNQELTRWGRSRLRTVSSTTSRMEEDYIYNHKDLDFISLHYYDPDGVVMDPNPDTDAYGLRPCFRFKEAIKYAYEKNTTLIKRPVMSTEYCPLIWDRTFEHINIHANERPLPYTYDEKYCLNNEWEHICNGGWGTGLRWPNNLFERTMSNNLSENYGLYLNGNTYLVYPKNSVGWEYNPFNNKMYSQQSSISVILKNIDWESFDYKGIPNRISINASYSSGCYSAVSVSWCGDSTQMLGRFLNTQQTSSATINATFTGFKNQYYSIKWFDDETAELLYSTFFLVEDNSITLTLPSFSTHRVIIIKPAD
jgi:hypothetical protein